eukprot:SAG25_NODE_2435_length_1610_cov_1.592985_3_plen_54_part_01
MTEEVLPAGDVDRVHRAHAPHRARWRGERVVIITTTTTTTTTIVIRGCPSVCLH